MALGAGISILGFLPYAVTDLRWNEMRTLLVSAPGAAILLLMLPEFLPIRERRIGFVQWALATVLTALSMGAAVGVHLATHQRVLDEQRILASIAATAPQFEPETGLVLIFDDARSEFLARGLAGRHAILTSALQFLYQDDDLVAFSLGNIDHPVNPFQVGPEGVSGVTTGGMTTMPYGRLVVFAADANGSVRLVETLPWSVGPAAVSAYQPWTRIRMGAPPPQRICLNLAHALRPAACN